ncbi:hypothetical protein MTO96_034881 [Rhipicephalus appendiculatus]
MYRCTITFALTVLCTENIALAKLGPPGGPRKLHYDDVDAFKVASQFKDVVSISDSDNDTIFDCVVANRTDIDYEAQTLTYVWTFPGVNGSSK